MLRYHVLEHVPDDERAVRELRRVLDLAGRAILQVPIPANSAVTFEDPAVVELSEQEGVFGQFDLVRIYGQDHADRSQNNGFTVQRVPAIDAWLGCGVNPAEDPTFCST